MTLKALLFAGLLVTCTSASAQQSASFEDYKTAFWQTVSATFGDVRDQSAKSSVFATNVFLGAGMKTAFDKSQVRVEASLPLSTLNPQPSEVDLKVSKVFKNCDLCPKCDLNPLTWGACLCDAATAALVLACNATNDLVNLFHDVTFGRAQFNNVALSASAGSSPLSIQFDPALSSAQLLGAISGNGNVQGNIDWTWTSLAGLFTACPPQTITVPATNVSFQSLSLPMASVIKQQSDKDGLTLKLNVSGGSLEANISDLGPKIISANPRLIASCPIGFAFLTGFTVVGQVIPIKKDFDLPAEQFDAKLANFTVPSPDQTATLPLTIAKNSLSIGAVNETVSAKE
jgi:hypothetical protein